MDYISETINFETSGYFNSDLGDLMPIAMANVLRIPIVIVTSESHTPLISVCPEETILYSTPLFLTYSRLGAGHYDAAVSMLTCKLKIKHDSYLCISALNHLFDNLVLGFYLRYILGYLFDSDCTLNCIPDMYLHI
jgi:hypothetical protein